MLIAIDRGAVLTKVLIHDGERIVKKWSEGRNITFRKSLESIFQTVLSMKISKAKIITINFEIPVAKRVDPFKALKKGVMMLKSDVKSVIEIGGERARFLKIGDDGKTEDFSISEQCASGTGLFIEGQAERLKKSLDELSELALKASKPAKIAGRCAVFAKSDMIHLQQKGIPIEEIAYGLCYSMAMNLISNLLKGKEIIPPLFVGGGCSQNKGIIRALKEILKIDEIYPSTLPGFEPALGACHLDGEIEEVEISQLLEKIKDEGRQAFVSFYSPLKKVNKKRLPEPEHEFDEEMEGYIGVDVGSVSTNIVVIDREGNLLSSVYLPTKGRPIEVMNEGFGEIKRRFKKGLRVLGCGTTGSGRYLAQAYLNADIVKNEIVCQMKGTLFYFPDADTIFEIGGQDSKFISLENGVLKDFSMNKICAAGTGSFIEEQVSIMNLDVKRDFSNFAFKSQKPTRLSCHCTVFMEKAVSSALARGDEIEDICAGIGYAIVENYLERVVEKRKIGKKIVFQGGVASNDAVVSAFESVLGREIEVHPYNRLSGAIGAALLAKELVKGRSRFRFPERIPEMKSFECQHCSNYCDVSVLKISEKEFAFFGDTCERYTSGKKVKALKGLDLSEEWTKKVEKFFEEERPPRSHGTVGIPRASSIMLMLPFWATFFKALGFRPLLSPPSSRETLIKSGKLLQAITCLPIKFTAGHVASLLETADFVFLPAINSFGENEFTCPYTQSLPYMLKDSQKFLTPVLSSFDEKNFIEEFSRYSEKLGISQHIIKKAYREAMRAQQEFERDVRIGKEFLKREGIPVVVIGRPYNIYDPYLNLNLFSHLLKIGFNPVPMNYLVTEFKDELFIWKYSKEGLKTLAEAISKRRAYPIILSNYGCGIDAFAHKVFEEVLGDYPHLFLEFDEHRGEAGLITRLEALNDLLKEREKEKINVFVKIPERVVLNQKDMKKMKVYIPYFADHAFAFSGALRNAGIDANVLPPPDQRIKTIGEQNSSGKECHAYSILLGDLIHLLNKEKEPFVFFFPGTRIPCLLNQYGTGMNLFLKKIGARDVVVFTPHGDEFVNLIGGMKKAENFYRNLFAIDLLHKLICLIRPFEIEKGSVLKVYEKCLKAMEMAGERGEIFPRFKKCVKELKGIKLKKTEMPHVGVAGDIYTRVNRAANFDLFNALDERGIVGVPSPFEIDIIDFGIYKNFHLSIKNRKLGKILLYSILLLRKELELRKFWAEVKDVLGKYDEPSSFGELEELTDGLTENYENELFYLNVAKMVHFAERGVDGIINATCFNCMVGSASSAIVEKIKERYNIPVVTLVYSNEKDQNTESLLGAFCEEVKERWVKKRASRI
jgi:predicted CoA-substrate-specific enzyme activase